MPALPAKKNGIGVAAAVVDAGVVEQTGTDVDERRLPIRNVRRGLHPLQSGVGPDHRASPAVHAHDAQLRADAEPVVEERRELADRHSMAHRNRVEADERFVGGLEDRSFDRRRRSGLGRSSTQNSLPNCFRALHRVGHRRDVRVRARADVLNVEEQNVDAVEHRRARMAGGAVEAVDRQVRLRVDVGGDRRARAAVAAKAVFGRIDRFDANLPVVQDRVDDRFEARRDAALIGDDADRAAAEIAPGLRAERLRRRARCGRAGGGSAPQGAPASAQARRRRLETSRRSAARSPCEGFRRRGRARRARERPRGHSHRGPR